MFSRSRFHVLGRWAPGSEMRGGWQAHPLAPRPLEMEESYGLMSQREDKPESGRGLVQTARRSVAG